jgi:tetratricopeptide (TPR) repeat protein
VTSTIRPFVAVMFAFGLGAGAASTGWWVAQLDRSTSPPVIADAPAGRDDASTGTASAPAATAALPEDRGEVARRLDTLEAKIDALAATVRPNGDRVPVPDQTIDEHVLARSLLRAQELREQQRIAAMSDTELLEEARRLGQKGNDPAAAAALLQQLLARNLQPAQRVDAMTQLGMAQREQDAAQSIATLQSAIALAGADSPAGAWASFQLLWSARRQGDHAMAIGAAEAALRSPGLNAKLRPTARWALASAAIDGGDVNRARIELQSLRNEGSGNPEVAKIVTELEQRLAGR